MRFPYCITFSEIKRICFSAQSQFANCRYGQAVCNAYEFPKEIEDQLYQCNDREKVHSIIHDLMINSDYQNG